MWQNALYGISLSQCEGIKFFHDKKKDQKDFEVVIGHSVIEGLNELPLYLKMPLKIYAFFLNLLCFIFNGRLLKNLEPNKRHRFINFMSRFPFYGIFNKFVRSKVFLRVFNDL
ncbi:MAG: hypothetical protein HQM16_16770 [Deltaproteobacteria bacterium]|nr:hypothetical protein [Deltaproteobacteria bacterium]